MTPNDIEEEMTDAGKADSGFAEISGPDGNPITVRVRTRPEPVHTKQCKHCGNQFWFKKSHGYRTYDGKYHLWRVPCGWCSTPQYFPIDEDENIVEEFIPRPPRKKDLTL